MRILVIGDYISDVYTFGTATRLCPEAPVPVIVPETFRTSEGGAGLVYEQLSELGADALNSYGSWSKKERIFAGNHLICRIDNDSTRRSQPDCDDGWFKEEELDWAEAIVVSDYGKGAMTRELAQQIVATEKPCFVDAKHHWHWYWNGKENVAIFPNEHEIDGTARFSRVVRKLGSNGCTFKSHNKDARGIPEEWWMPATVSEVVDTTGAGDIFMASFVYAWSLQHPAEDCLRFANEMAGESCRHRGTFVVPREFATVALDRLRVSRAPKQQAHDWTNGSNSLEPQQQTAQGQAYRWKDTAITDTLLSSSLPAKGVVTTVELCNPQPARTLPKSPLGPIESTDTLTPSDREILDEPSGKPPWEG